MKQIIDGKLYDTETAELIYTYDPPFMISYVRYYRTKNGAYFSHYLDDITLLEESEVKDFIGKSDIGKYIELFGSVDEA